LVVGTAVTPGLGARLRHVVLRLLAVGGLALLAWLLGVLLNSGTASAAQNSTVSPGTPHSTDGTDSGTGGGLLGGLLGGLGNTVGNVTGTVSGITTTVTNGSLTIDFHHRIDNPLINAIEVIQQ